MKLHWQSTDGEYFCIVNDVVLRVSPLDVHDPHLPSTMWHCTIGIPDVHFLIAEYTVHGMWQAGASWCEYTYLQTFPNPLAFAVGLVGFHAERTWWEWKSETQTIYDYAISEVALLQVVSHDDTWLWLVSPRHTATMPVSLTKMSGKCLTLTEAKRSAVLAYFSWLFHSAISTDADTLKKRIENPAS